MKWTKMTKNWPKIMTENHDWKWPKIMTENDIIWHEWQNGEIHQKIAKLVNQEQQLINF